jgi:hypothetical protein
MSTIKASARTAGGWSIDGQDLRDGDEIQIMWFGQWLNARVHYNWKLIRYQLKIGDQTLPLASGLLVRRLAQTHPAQAVTVTQGMV